MNKLIIPAFYKKYILSSLFIAALCTMTYNTSYSCSCTCLQACPIACQTWVDKAYGISSLDSSTCESIGGDSAHVHCDCKSTSQIKKNLYVACPNSPNTCTSS